MDKPKDSEKSEFQKAEATLTAYFKAKEKRNGLVDATVRTKAQIEQVEFNLKNISIPAPSIIASYSGMIVTGGERMPAIERLLIQQEGRLEDELVELRIKLARLEQKLRNIENKWSGFEFTILGLLDGIETLIAEIKYTKFTRSCREIARIYQQRTGQKISHNTVNLKRELIVARVMEALEHRC